MRSNKTLQYRLLQYSFSHKFSCYSNEPSPSGAAEHIDSSGVFPWRVPHETPCPAARIDCEPLPCRLKKACRPAGARGGRHGAVDRRRPGSLRSPATPSPCRACTETEEMEARLARLRRLAWALFLECHACMHRPAPAPGTGTSAHPACAVVSFASGTWPWPPILHGCIVAMPCSWLLHSDMERRIES